MTAIRDSASVADRAPSALVDIPSAAPSSEPQPPVVLVGRLVSIRLVMGALRRRRKLWLCTAALGLVLGLAFHVVVPRSYYAWSTLYLAHAPGTDDGVDMANDLALLQTNAVGQRAVRLLHEPSLTPQHLLGKAPGAAQSDNVLTLEVSGPTRSQAVKRVNALATAFLSFRSLQAQQQMAATNAALEAQIRGLEHEIQIATAKVDTLGTSKSSPELASLIGQQSSETAEMSSLTQTVNQNRLADLTVQNGSRVLTPGTPVHASALKLFGVSGLSGLVGGLVIGMGIVAFQEVLSDRVRRRDEVASLLGAPVDLSLPSFRHPRTGAVRWIRRMAADPAEPVATLANYLRRRGVACDDRTTLLVLAADETAVPAAALALLATRLTAEGRDVLIADCSSDRPLLQSLAAATAGNAPLAGTLSVVAPSADEFDDGVVPAWLRTSQARAVLVLATLDPGRGAAHLAWLQEAVVTVTTGRSSASRVNTIAALARAAGLSVRSGILVDADEDDETVGLLKPETPLVGLPVDVAATVSFSP